MSSTCPGGSCSKTGPHLVILTMDTGWWVMETPNKNIRICTNKQKPDPAGQ